MLMCLSAQSVLTYDIKLAQLLSIDDTDMVFLKTLISLGLPDCGWFCPCGSPWCMVLLGKV
jgi:hypothetical protein